MTGHTIAMNISDALSIIQLLRVDVYNVNDYAWHLLLHANNYLQKQMLDAHEHAEDIYVSE